MLIFYVDNSERSVKKNLKEIKVTMMAIKTTMTRSPLTKSTITRKKILTHCNLMMARAQTVLSRSQDQARNANAHLHHRFTRKLPLWISLCPSSSQLERRNWIFSSSKLSSSLRSIYGSLNLACSISLSMSYHNLLITCRQRRMLQRD